ncbi:MAG: hypothetical protein AABX38_01590 [Candidatus Micrarchaeota archaeon]
MSTKPKYKPKPPKPSAKVRAEKDIMLATPTAMANIARMRKDRMKRLPKEELLVRNLDDAKLNYSRVLDTLFVLGRKDHDESIRLLALIALLNTYGRILDSKTVLTVFSVRLPTIDGSFEVDLAKNKVTFSSFRDQIFDICDLLKTS